MHASSSSRRKSERWPTAPFQAASRAFHAHRSILSNHPDFFKDRHTFFHAVVTPVACFAAGHRKIFKQQLAALDVAHRKLLRRVVGPPAGMDWSLLHGSNGGVLCFFPRRLLACGSGWAGSKPQHLISFGRVGECLEGKRHPHVRSLLGSSHCQTPHSSLEQIKKSLATRQAKAGLGRRGKNTAGLKPRRAGLADSYILYPFLKWVLRVEPPGSCVHRVTVPRNDVSFPYQKEDVVNYF